MPRFLPTFAVLATLNAVSISLPAIAADDLYAGAALGLVKSPNSTASGASGGVVKFDTGNMGAAFFGGRFQSNEIHWRGEAEVSRRALDLSTVSGTAAQGEALATSVMGNALVDHAGGQRDGQRACRSGHGRPRAALHRRRRRPSQG